MSAKQWGVLLVGILGVTVIALAVAGIPFVTPGDETEITPPEKLTTIEDFGDNTRPADGVELESGEQAVLKAEVAVVARKGNEKISDLEITVTEVHGWYVEGIYVDLFHRTYNEDTGQWERDDSKVDVHYPGILVNQPLLYNSSITEQTQPLLGIEWNLDSIGTSDEWEAVVLHHGLVLKPGPVGDDSSE